MTTKPTVPDPNPSAASTAVSPRPRPGFNGAAALGVVMFLVGIALVFYVFATANTLLNAPPPSVPIPAASPAVAAATGQTGNGAAPGAATMEIGKQFADLVRQLLILIVMCITGSTIATLGVHLFFKARSAPPA